MEEREKPEPELLMWLWLFPLLHALGGGEGRERRAFKYCFYEVHHPSYIIT
jgi:hypothetical protein